MNALLPGDDGWTSGRVAEALFIDAEVERDLGPYHVHRRSPEPQARHLAKLGVPCSLAPAGEPVSV